jgi:hypothetical protein
MAANSILINIGAKTADAVRDVNKFNKSLDGTRDSTGRLSKSLKGPLKAAAGIAAGAIAGAAVAAVNFGKAAYEDRNEAEKLAFTLDKIPGVTKKMIDANAAWIDSMELATHVSDTSLRESISKLTLATGDLGEAQRLTALAADVAAGSGKSLESVTTAMAKAVNGNTTALERQFPWLDKNKDGTVDLDEAVAGLTDRFDGAAEAAADLDPWQKLKTIWGQLKEQLGQWLLPVMDKFIDWFKKPENKKALQEHLTKIGEISYELGTKLAGAIETAMVWLSKPENQARIRVFVGWMRGIVDVCSDIAGWIWTVMRKLDDLFDKMAQIPKVVSRTGAPITPSTNRLARANRSSRADRAGGSSSGSSVPVMVSDEQLARAISSLLMRSGVRNGARPGYVL